MTVLQVSLLLTIGLVAGVNARVSEAHPCPTSAVQKQAVRKPAPSTTATTAPSPRDLLDLYAKTGRALKTLHEVDPMSPLLQRYRIVNINDVMRNPAKRAATIVELEKLHAAAKKLAP